MSCGQFPAGLLSVGVTEPLERGKIVAALREPGRVTVFELVAVKRPSVLVDPVLQGLHGAVLRLQERSVLPVALGREIHPLAAADRHGNMLLRFTTAMSLTFTKSRPFFMRRCLSLKEESGAK